MSAQAVRQELVDFSTPVTHTALPLATELRFRITDKSSPRSFLLGQDSLREDGLPWRLPLLSLLSFDEFAPIVKRLEQDGLIPSRTSLLLDSMGRQGDRWNVERLKLKDESGVGCQHVLDPAAWSSNSNSAVLYAFGQPFSYSFDWSDDDDGSPEFIWLVSKGGVARLRTREVFSNSSMEMIARTSISTRRRDYQMEENWSRPITVQVPEGGKYMILQSALSIRLIGFWSAEQYVFCLEPDSEGDGIALRCLSPFQRLPMFLPEYRTYRGHRRSHNTRSSVFDLRLVAGRLVEVAGMPLRLGGHTHVSRIAHSMLEKGGFEVQRVRL